MTPSDPDDQTTSHYPKPDPLAGMLSSAPQRIDSDDRSDSQPATVPFVPRIPGYLIDCELARGGMGVVYKAHQERLNRTVALKMILAGEYADPKIVERFLLEGEAVARLSHPNIIQIHDLGTHGGRPYFAMEFAEGGTLDEAWNKKPQRPRDVAEMVEKLSQAMALAHQKGVIHRDLKPANVLLTADDTPKIADFGLARLGDTGLTRSQAVTGTPAYMSPEQASGRSREVGPASDIWALGVILYEGLTGRVPFKGDTVIDTLVLVQHDEPIRPRRLNTSVPRDLETVCLKCLRKEPRERYASAAALAEDLDRFLGGKPIAARPVRTPEKLAKWAKRNPLSAGLIGVVLLSLVAGVFVSTILAIRANDRAEAEAQAKREAEAARDAAREAEQQAEEALLLSQRRLILNYVAYGRASLLASRLANAKDWQESRALREEYTNLARWLVTSGDPLIKRAVLRYSSALVGWTSGPPPESLQRRSLDLAHACRASWLATIENECADVAKELTRHLYARVCNVAIQLATAKSWYVAELARREFWELYWGELAIVESETVKQAMIVIGRAIETWEPTEPPPTELVEGVAVLKRECAAELQVTEAELQGWLQTPVRTSRGG